MGLVLPVTEGISAVLNGSVNGIYIVSLKGTSPYPLHLKFASIYRERIRQLESMLNQTFLLQTGNCFVLCRVVASSLDTLKRNPIEFCAVVLEIWNKGRWLGEAIFVLSSVCTVSGYASCD